MAKFVSALRFDPRGWTEAFKEEKNNLLFYLKSFKVAIKHIGATSYAGGMSNRNVDILIATSTFEDISSIQVRLESKGYKVISKDQKDLVMLKSAKKVNGYGITIRVMEYASPIFNRFNAFETLLKENNRRVVAYNKYREEIYRRHYQNFDRYQQLKFNYINHLIDEKFRFE